MRSYNETGCASWGPKSLGKQLTRFPWCVVLTLRLQQGDSAGAMTPVCAGAAVETGLRDAGGMFYFAGLSWEGLVAVLLEF